MVHSRRAEATGLRGVCSAVPEALADEPLVHVRYRAASCWAVLNCGGLPAVTPHRLLIWSGQRSCRGSQRGLENTVIAARRDVAAGAVSRRRERFAEEEMTGRS